MDHLVMADTRLESGAKGRDLLAGPMSRLVDEMLDRYAEWRDDAAGVHAAYIEWSGAPAYARAWRFSVYMAALEQEESSAKMYAAIIRELDNRRQLERDPRLSHTRRAS
jgi:hypothetical protein